MAQAITKKIITLDGEERELDDEMLVIADDQNPIAIAGIIGGEESAINNETNSIVLESANFDFITIRKTSKKLGLRTESSQRFEKSLASYNGVERSDIPDTMDTYIDLDIAGISKATEEEFEEIVKESTEKIIFGRIKK